jgi:hypothetical protein
MSKFGAVVTLTCTPALAASLAQVPARHFIARLSTLAIAVLVPLFGKKLPIVLDSSALGRSRQDMSLRHCACYEDVI